MVNAIVRAISVIALCVIGYAGYILYERELTRSVERHAATSSSAWLAFFSANVPDFETLFETGVVTAEQRHALNRAKSTLDVFRFKLFSSEGELTFVSDTLSDASATTQNLFAHNEEAAAVLRTGERFVALEDGTGDPDRPADYAEVYLPVVTNDGAAGVVEVYVDMTVTKADAENSFAQFALMILALGLAAMAIPTAHWAVAWNETRRKHEALKTTTEDQARLMREVRLIGDLNEWLQSSRSQAELFDMVVGFLTRLIPECEGQVYVYSNSRDVLDGSASWGGSPPHDHIHPEDCWSLRRGRTYEYGEAEIGFPCSHAADAPDRSYFCMPMLAHGETIGLLHLRQRAGVSEHQFRTARAMAQLCAEQISMAIANVRMRDELQDQSIRDSLTGLYNRRHLTDALRRYMARADREGHSVSLLSIDIDHFKRFNDNYGHDAGDMVLRAVGEVLDRAVDGDELACRPGGEEFMIVLPDSTVADALHRAEAIREQIQAISIRYGEKTLPSITGSIGVAVSPADGTIPQDLMRAADEALYSAKAAGRNRAVLTTLMGMDSERDSPDPVAPKEALAAE